jgi:hypothetical protein
MRKSSSVDHDAPIVTPFGNAVANGCLTPCWSSFSHTYAGMERRLISVALSVIWPMSSSTVRDWLKM